MTVRVITLGGLDGSLDGARLDWLASHWLRAGLLVYLAIERAASRETLEAIFWPEAEPEAAARRLNQTVYALRQALGNDCIVTRGRQLMAGQLLQADAVEFEVAAGAGKHEDAIRLYQGPFLNAVHLGSTKEFENWVDRRRAHFQRLFRKACRGLLDHKLATHDLPGAVAACRSWVAPDPYDDDAQHHLIETLMGSGQRSEAIRAYDSYEKLLAQAQLTPLEHTQKLVAHLRDGSTQDQRNSLPVDPELITALADTAIVRIAAETPEDSPESWQDSAAIQSSTSRRLLTWRNAVVAGIAALGFAVTGYYGKQLLGTSAATSLRARGIFQDREPVILADFGNATNDSLLGPLVTEVLRVDLLQSQALTVMSQASIADALQRMGRPDQAQLTPEIAREMAIRDGVKAILHGQVGTLGSGYVLLASIQHAGSGEALETFRENALTSDSLIAAVDRLSARIRESAGESLRLVRAEQPLSKVTTASLDALRAYTLGEQRGRRGDFQSAFQLLEKAVELDPEFAMAYRLLGAYLGNSRNAERGDAAIKRAYELRNRLTRRERLLAEAHYFSSLEDRQRTLTAYRQLLEEYPDDPSALNNLALRLNQSSAEAEEAVALLERVVSGPGRFFLAYRNLINVLWELRRDSAAEAVTTALIAQYPESLPAASMRPLLLQRQRRWAESHQADEELAARRPAEQIASLFRRAGSDGGLGRLAEARQHLEAALATAREMGNTRQYADGTWRLAWLELFVAESPERGRAALQRTDWSHRGLNEQLTLQNAALIAPLVGNAALGVRLKEALDSLVASGHARYGSSDEPQWALALARGDGRAALDAIDRYVRHLYGNCGDRRCEGHFERALALDALGRTSDAIAAYERHIEVGPPTTAPVFDALVTPRALERLGQLYDQQGNRAKAAQYYTRFAETWKHADAELQPRALLARQRAAALRGDRR